MHGNRIESGACCIMPAPPLGITARAEVERVIDGDTIIVHLMLPVRVRLLKCYAPEIHGVDRIAGERSKEAMERMLPVGAKCIVHVPTQDADALGDVLTFGRVLGDVYRVGDDESVSQLLVGMGLAMESRE